MTVVSFSAPLLLLLCHCAKHVGAASLPKAASTDVPWDDLRALLSSPDLLTLAETATWKEQCWDPFLNENPAENPGFQLSNYQLLYQDSGLCMDHAACAYQHCLAPPDFETTYAGHPNFLLPGQEDIVVEDRLNLPDHVLQAGTLSDVVFAIQFCNEHDIGISVKTSGHSYFGASTGKGTLLIKLSPNYPIYSHQGGLVECDDVAVDESPFGMACALAISRGKPAVLRVGGGELSDHAYRAVSFDWNRERNSTNKYHLVGSASGTVAAAGGWLSSGGLSGTTGMRLFGFGVDQVLHLEMVLPSGAHVRFGPTEWEQVDGFQTAKTTAVTGYCNANPLDAEEENWDWQRCEEDIDFDDLWFAARGGGGGTFGITTAIYYQLHDMPRNFEVLAVGAAATSALPGEESWTEWTPTMAGTLFPLYIRFLLEFFYRPASLSVSAAVSNGCQSALTVSLSPIAGGRMYCIGGSGAAIVESWKTYISEHADTLVSAGFDNETVTAMPDLFQVALDVETFADFRVSQNNIAGVPQGRLSDAIQADIVPATPSFPGYADANGVHIPLANLTDESAFEDVSDLLVEYSLVNIANPLATLWYSLGGLISSSTDQTDSVNPSRRAAGLFMALIQDEYKSRMYDIIWDAQDGRAVTGGEFPGTSCHNHAFIYENGPLKTDWTEACPSKWTQEERDELCLSPQEAAWGTRNLERLESIKKSIDPNSLFVCNGGVGYDSSAKSLLTDDEEELANAEGIVEESDDEKPSDALVFDEEVIVDKKGETEKELDSATSGSGVSGTGLVSLHLGFGVTMLSGLLFG